MTIDSTPTRFLRAEPGHLDGSELAWWIDVDVSSDASVKEFLDAVDADRALDPTIAPRADLSAQRTHLMGCPHCQTSLTPLRTHIETALAVSESVSEPERAASLVAAANSFLIDVPLASTPVAKSSRKSWRRRFGFGAGSGVSPVSPVSNGGGLGALRPRLVVPLVLAVVATAFVAVALSGSHTSLMKTALNTAASTEAVGSVQTIQSGGATVEDVLADVPPAAAVPAPATEAASAAETEAATADAAALETAPADRSAATDRTTSDTQTPEVSADATSTQPQAVQPESTARPAPKRPRAKVATTMVPTNASIPADPSESAAAPVSNSPSEIVWLGELGGFADVTTARSVAKDRATVVGLLVPVTTPGRTAGASNPTVTTTAAPAAPAAIAAEAPSATATRSATTPSKASSGLPSSPCLSENVRAWASAQIGSIPVVIVIRHDADDVDDVFVLDASTCQPIL